MRKILLIEDNADVRETTAELLTLENYEVYTAKDGEEGIKTAPQFQPDLILCDIMMPGKDGYAVFEQLSLALGTSTIPFIFLTAKAEKADLRKGMNLGADDYLTKPFEMHELLQAINARLRKHDFLKKEFSRDIDGFTAFMQDALEYLDLELIARDYEPCVCPKKSDVFMEGDAAQTLYFIKSGMVKTHKATESGREFLTGIHKDGDFLGQLSLMQQDGNYLETATVLHDAIVYAIPKESFKELLYGKKEVSRKFMDIISRGLIQSQELLADMAYATVRQRMAKALLAMHHKGILSSDPSAGVDMSREDFAGLIGTATETAIRNLSILKDERLIRMGDGRRINIIDEQGLQYVADFG